uniref:Peptidase C1A papain C-terminal domain-containing protein n=1 Tax=Kalanchoe fedtschenkoi TaxID=63787 RepID=A0A7N0RHV8_KALFE
MLWVLLKCAVALNAVFMQTYIGGVSCPLICGKRWINHGVLLVGYGAKGFSILRLGNRPYWIIKNSWVKKWGEDGYYRLCRGHGMCGVNCEHNGFRCGYPGTLSYIVVVPAELLINPMKASYYISATKQDGYRIVGGAPIWFQAHSSGMECREHTHAQNPNSSAACSSNLENDGLLK